MGESAPFWWFSAASYPDLEESRPVDTVPISVKRTHDVVSDTSNGVCQFVRPCMKYRETFPLFFYRFALITSILDCFLL